MPSETTGKALRRAEKPEAAAERREKEAPEEAQFQEKVLKVDEADGGVAGVCAGGSVNDDASDDAMAQSSAAARAPSETTSKALRRAENKAAEEA